MKTDSGMLSSAIVCRQGPLYNRLVTIRHWPEKNSVWVTILHPEDKHEFNVPREYLREVTGNDIKRLKRRRIGQPAPKEEKSPTKKQVLGKRDIDGCWETVKDLMNDQGKYRALRDRYRGRDESDQRKAIRRQLRLLKQAN